MMANLRNSAAALFFLSQVVGTTEAGEDCVPIAALGTSSLDKYDFSVSMAVDDDDAFTLKVNFKHDGDLPIPTDPANQCDPAIVPPEIASDGLPYWAFRWSYESVSEEVKKVTGIDHISIDFNPCGHPPVEKFGAPHYDLHMYRETPEYRTCMTCNTFPGAPICNFFPDEQTTESGRAYFDISMIDGTDQPKNMPEGFVVGPDHAVVMMGGHAWNPDQEPPSSAEWVDPVWIMGTYDAQIAYYEPMIPLVFMSGDSNNVFQEEITYQAQTMKELPSTVKVKYNGTTGVTNVILKGSKMIDCEDKPKKFTIDMDGTMKEKDCDWLASKKGKKPQKQLCKKKVQVNGKDKKLHLHCKETCGQVGRGKCAFLKDS